MYMRILRKDLKRKKTMNCILLLFVLISTMFASSSVNNIVSVMGGLDHYFEKAGMSDYFILARDVPGESEISQTLDVSENVSDYRCEKVIFGTADNIRKDGKRAIDFSNTAFFMSIDDIKLNFFDGLGEPITSIEQGKVYLPAWTAKDGNIEIGDELDISFGDNSVKVEYAGIIKDALLGSPFVGIPRIILNDNDYRALTAGDVKKNYGGSIYYIDTDDTDALAAETADLPNVMLTLDISTVKQAYLIDIVVAAMMLIVSVCLILIAFSVLKFTIGFTLTEEFREIGVMKALGLKNSSIRGLYLVKYLGISVIGSAIGYAASIPFGNMMLMSVGERIVLGNDNEIFIGILCAVAVVLIIMGFCHRCTGRIKKMSPIDAVRSGQTGERFRKKGILSLSKSKLSARSFLPLNDVLSAPKQYGMITAIFTFCMLLVMIMANTANTLKSDSLLFLTSVKESDLYYSDSASFMEVIGGVKTIDEAKKEIEDELAKNGMPAKVTFEPWYKLPVKTEYNSLNLTMLHNKDTKCSDYVYSEGTPPQNAHEIALTPQIAEKLGVGIGDEVSITIGDMTEEYMVSALFISFNYMGEIGRLHESVDMSGVSVSSALPFQISFDDHPDDKTIEERKEKLKDIFDNDLVFNTEEFVEDYTGAADTVTAVKNLVFVIGIVIILLISILMERSFISKEKSEIALMKAMGFKNRSVVAHHSMRFVISAVIAGILSCVLCLPLTKLTMNPIFGMMGAISGVVYTIKPLEIFVVYPLIMVAITIVGASLTALYTRTIKASDTADIE